MDLQDESLNDEFDEVEQAIEPADGAEDDVLRRAFEPVEDPWGWEPTADATDTDFGNFVHYSDRADTDFVVSGPLQSGWGPGRWFPSRALAQAWALEKYGPANVKLVKQSLGRWSFLVRKNVRN